MNKVQFYTLAGALLASLALAGPAAAQQWPDVPSSPRIEVPDHGVEVSIVAVHYGMFNLDYLQIRERTIGGGPWQAVYGQQHGSDVLAQTITAAGGYNQYILSVLPAYNQFLATRYPSSSAGPVFGTSTVDLLNKALYESFRFLAQTNGQISVGLK